MSQGVIASGLPAYRSRSRPAFHVLLAAFMVCVAIAGFWPQYYGRLVSGSALEPRTAFWAIHVHSALFMAWLFMFLGQAVLAWQGRMDLHRRFGPAFAAYGFAAAAFGVYAALAVSAHTVVLGRAPDRAAGFLLAPLSDMVLFAGFLAAAVAWRRSPEAHKRLMFLATWSIAMVPFGRLLNRFISPQDPWIWQPAILGPLLFVVAADWATRRRLHPAWLVGLLVFLARANRRPLMETDAWLGIGRALLQPFL